MVSSDTFFSLDHEKHSIGTQPPAQPVMDPWETPQSQPTGFSQQGPLRPPFAQSSQSVAQQEQYETAKQEFDDVVTNNRAVDQRTKALLARHQSMIMKLFPGKMQRLINEKDRLLVGEALDCRVRLLKLANEVRLEAMRDKYDCFLKAYKGHNRLMLTQIMMKYLVELQRTVREEEMKGFEQITVMYQNAATIPGQERQQAYIGQIRQREMNFMQMIARLMGSFESLIDENLPRF